MELSINTLVVIILGVLIVGGGITLTANIVTEAQKLLPDVSEAEKARLTQQLDRGDPLVVINNVRSGGHGDYVFFVGFKNQLPEKKVFSPRITAVNHIASDGTISTTNLPEPFYAEREYTLERGEKQTNYPFSVTIEKGMPRGTYTFTVELLYADPTDTPQTPLPHSAVQVLISVS